MQDKIHSSYKQLEQKSKYTNMFLRWFLYFVLVIFALYFIFPLYVMVVTSLKTMEEIRQGTLLTWPSGLNFDSWLVAWGGRGYGAGDTFLKPYFWNSIKMVVPAVFFSTFIGAMAGYVLTKWRFKGDKWVFLFLLFGCFIPYQAILLPMARTLGVLGISNSVIGLVLVHTVYGIPFTTLFFRNFYVSIPSELVKAARIDGAGILRIIWNIYVPLSMPTFVAYGLVSVSFHWNNFLWPLIITNSVETRPLTVGLSIFSMSEAGVEWATISAGTLMTTAPLFIAFLIFQRQFIASFMTAGIK